MEITGKIIEKPFGEGSKSEHEAVYLVTPKDTYVLQMEDENPFEQPTLHKLVGKTVTVDGLLDKYLFTVKTIMKIK